MLHGKNRQPFYLKSILQYWVAKRSSKSLTVLDISSCELRRLRMEMIWRHQKLYFGCKILQSYILHTVMNTGWKWLAKMLMYWIAKHGYIEIYNIRGETGLHPDLTGLLVCFRAGCWTGFNRFTMSTLTVWRTTFTCFQIWIELVPTGRLLQIEMVWTIHKCKGNKYKRNVLLLWITALALKCFTGNMGSPFI